MTLKEFFKLIFGDHLLLEYLISEDTFVKIVIIYLPSFLGSFTTFTSNRTFLYKRKEKIWYEEINKKNVEVDNEKLIRTLDKMCDDLVIAEAITRSVFYNINKNYK